MAQEFTVGANSTVASRLANVDRAAVHLSDGTLVFLYYLGSTGDVILAYSSDHSTVTTIATIPTSNAGDSTKFARSGTDHPSNMTLVRDSADNLYVIGVNANGTTYSVMGQAYVKGSGYTWTQQSIRVATFTSSTYLAVAAAVWCDTGGGTSSAGHILAIAGWESTSGATNAVILDAGVLLAGTGTVQTQHTASPAFLANGGSTNDPEGWDLAQDGHGATSGIAAVKQSTTTVGIGSWAVGSAGTLTTNLSITGASPLSGDFLAGPRRVRIVRVSSNVFAIAFGSAASAGQYTVTRYSKTAQLTTPADSGAPTSMPLKAQSHAWDVFLDPGTAGRIWIIATDAVSGGAQAVYRLQVTVSSGVTFGSAAVLDDSVTPVNTSGEMVRAVRQPIGSKVDWQVHHKYDGSNYALAGDYSDFNTAPNAPTLVTPITGTIDFSAVNRFDWDFSDPDAGDSQSKFDLRYRLTSSGTWIDVTGTTPNTYYDMPAGTLVAGDYEWQVRTYDAVGDVGPYSGSSFFTSATAPSPPSITDPVNGATIAAEQDDVTWSAPSQDSYQVRIVADDGLGSPDTAVVDYDSGEIVSTSARTRTLTFDENNSTKHIQVRIKDDGLWSTWASIMVLVSYTVPATPTITVDTTSQSGAIQIQATHPTPAGSEPTVNSIDVYRRDATDDGSGIRIAAGELPSAIFTDWFVASGHEYAYRVKANGDNGTSSYSAWSEDGSGEVTGYYGGY